MIFFVLLDSTGLSVICWEGYKERRSPYDKRKKSSKYPGAKAWKDVREDIRKSDAIQSEMEITKNKNPQARQK